MKNKLLISILKNSFQGLGTRWLYLFEFEISTCKMDYNSICMYM